MDSDGANVPTVIINVEIESENEGDRILRSSSASIAYFPFVALRTQVSDPSEHASPSNFAMGQPSQQPEPPPARVAPNAVSSNARVAVCRGKLKEAKSGGRKEIPAPIPDFLARTEDPD